MSPDEDAALLLVIVRRHLAALRLSLDPSFPDEEWGFLAQQALEKILKGWIVLHDQNPPFTHNLSQLSEQANLPLQTALLALQPYAVEVRYQAEGKPLPR